MSKYKNIISLEKKQDLKRKEICVLERCADCNLSKMAAPVYIQSHMLFLQHWLDISPLGGEGSISP